MTSEAAHQTEILHDGGSTTWDPIGGRPLYVVTTSATAEQAATYATSGHEVEPEEVRMWRERALAAEAARDEARADMGRAFGGLGRTQTRLFDLQEAVRDAVAGQDSAPPFGALRDALRKSEGEG